MADPCVCGHPRDRHRPACTWVNAISGNCQCLEFASVATFCRSPLPEPPVAAPQGRRRLPVDRQSVTRRFRLHSSEAGEVVPVRLYFTAGLYDDGRVGEVFVKADRTGTLVRGMLDAVGTLTSLLLQHDVPLEVVTTKLRHTRYAPSGFTGDSEFPSCSSPLDLLAQWLDKRFGGGA